MNEKMLKSIMLTPQRYQLLKEFAEAVHLGQRDVKGMPQSGMILSGPNGVGKTVESYLIACTAYANDSILVYIVRHHFSFSHIFFVVCCF